MHLKLAATAAIAALGLSSCSLLSGEDASPSPSPSVTESATASATATAAPMPTGPCPARADTMDDATARQVADNPSTGETWLEAPQSIEEPAGSATGSETWWKLGMRGDIEILAMDWGLAELVVAEREPDGTLTWIGRPTPTSQGLFEVPARANMEVNNEQCYESLALPSTLTLAGGVTVGTPHPLSAPTEDPQWTGEITTEGEWGATSLLLITDNQPEDYDNNALPEPARLADYELLLPFGWYQQIEFNPFEGVDALGLDAINYYDYSCGAWAGPAVWGGATTDADWSVVGQLGGYDIGIATASNPYAQERYDAYVDATGETGATTVSYTAFIAQQGVVGKRADDGGWWLGINPSLSPRAWC